MDEEDTHFRLEDDLEIKLEAKYDEDDLEVKMEVKAAEDYLEVNDIADLVVKTNEYDLEVKVGVAEKLNLNLENKISDSYPVGNHPHAIFSKECIREFVSPCTKCEQMFKSEIELKTHIKQVHSQIRLNKFSCTMCGRLFDRNRRLIKHIKNIHTSKKGFFCQLCEQVFHSNRVYRDHIKSIHRPENKRNTFYPCSKCDRIFLRKFSMVHHRKKTHFDEANDFR